MSVVGYFIPVCSYHFVVAVWSAKRHRRKAEGLLLEGRDRVHIQIGLVGDARTDDRNDNIFCSAGECKALASHHLPIRDVESELATMKAEHDPLASHIFVARRRYRNVNDTKSGKRREMSARLSFDTACNLGFRGSLDERERLMGAVARR